MSTQKKHNFGAGPCILPISVMEKAASAVLDWNDSGLSILEVSHRSAEFQEVMNKAQLLVRELLFVPDSYEVLFLQGGASMQFSMVPQNLLHGSGKKKAAYLDTGYFAQKAIAQARIFGEVEVVATSADKGYSYIPEAYSLPRDAAYLHVTSNNTIEGTQIVSFDNIGIPLVCDMSSDIFSREIQVRDFDLIYAGAQKNMGPAGMTLVIVNKELLNKIQYTLPAMHDYRVYASSNSLYNTPPVFSIYVSMLNMMWLRDQGGVSAMERQNAKKAELLYGAIDKSSIFQGMAAKCHRSVMNVTFRCPDKRHEEGFLNYAAERGIVGIKGYPSVGGFRASLYNALPLFSVEYLVKVMAYYEKTQELKSMNASSRMMA